MQTKNKGTQADKHRQFASNDAVQSLFDLNYSLYVTENYVDSYSYPLVAFLHDGYRSERDLWNWFPAVSDQNYLGLGVRAPFPHRDGYPGQFEWKLRRPDASIAAIREAVLAVQRDWAVHPHRLYLFGEGDGALVGIQHLILQGSLEFDSTFAAGIICRSLPKNWPEWLPHIQGDLRGRVLFLEPMHDAGEFAAVDALTEAGLEVTTAVPSLEIPTEKVINHWIMAGINTAIY